MLRIYLAMVMLMHGILARYFVIDYENDRFLKDGLPYQYISGSIHYFRIPSAYWWDRLTKMKASGLDAVQTYVAWNVHEPVEGKFEFSHDSNLTSFVKLAQKAGLDVIMRIGPYMCAEFENGGLPWWLLKIPNVEMRQADPRFLYYVTKWYSKLMPMLLPLLYKNGGPIISMQIENEYGSRNFCDRNYMIFLRDLIRSYVGEDFVLFTVDGGGMDYLKCGFVPEVYPTVDFGLTSREGVNKAFAAQRAFAPKGPLVNTEFYPGWLDLWGYNHSVAPIESIINSMTYMYEIGASFNFYMFEGGTNFGYMNGASSSNEPVTTSYDYDAPLSEAGDPTPKFFAIRNHIQKLKGIKLNQTIPDATKKLAYGKIPVSFLANILTLLNTVAPNETRIHSLYPKTFEDIDFPYGFVLYETRMNFTCKFCNLKTNFINNNGHVIVDEILIGKIAILGNKTLNNFSAVSGSKLQILVENAGRQCSGFNDPKGLGNVTIDEKLLINWSIYPITLEKIFDYFKRDTLAYANLKQRTTMIVERSSSSKSINFIPSIYYGKFYVSEIADTFFDSSDWGKGQFFFNGINIGRYWPSKGPQMTLFVPKMFVRKLNYFILFELEKPGHCTSYDSSNCYVFFKDKPFLNKTIPGPPKFYPQKLHRLFNVG